MVHVSKRVIFFVSVFFIHFSWCQTPKISVITSVYKADLFIKHYLQEIVQQTIFPECEIILVNANSPGNEEQTILPYVSRYPNIRYVKLTYDPGLYGVWNMGIKMTQAPIVTTVNVDDAIAYNFLEKHVDALVADPQVDCVFSSVTITTLANQPFAQHKYLRVCHAVPFEVKKGIIIEVPPTRAVWRTSIHEKYGYFMEDFTIYGDVEFFSRIITQGITIKRVPGVWGSFYINPKGLSNQQNKPSLHTHELKKWQRLYNHITRSYRLPS